MRLALFQPDIPQNAGAVLRLAACLDVPVDIIEPCGFLLDDRRLRRSAMDYLSEVTIRRHESWRRFNESSGESRLVLLTTSGDRDYLDFAFRSDDILLLGQESAGVPADVHDAADARLRVPMAGGLRSINVALVGAMVLAEALRQTDGFPRRAA